jgi:hypothetical protein
VLPSFGRNDYNLWLVSVSSVSLPQPAVAMPKILIGISILFVTLSLVLGYLNSNKLKGLRDDLTTTISARDQLQTARAAGEKKLKAKDAAFTAEQSKASAAEAKATSAEAELSKAQNDKAEIEAKLQASETQIADLQQRVADATVGAIPGSPEGALPNDIKATLDDTKHQLQAAEQEKALLADQVQIAQDKVTKMEQENKRRESGVNQAGVHGLVLAVNQAYNFVVLNMGDRQGIVSNSEMLVMRQGALIAKIRISSVEPTTSIGDILSSTLARGVQVQPGDTVVYAGNTRS